MIEPTLLLALLSGAVNAHAQALSTGTIHDDVRCVGDASESYALYLPSTHSPDRPANVLMAFHPSARGRAMVEKYQAAAEQYGFIVAGSNTSRNGPWSVSARAVAAMSEDLGRRFAIDAARVYLTGMSGGARVAMQVALDSKAIAGVIASSAGFPDSQPRQAVPFAVFGTAGTDDFNYVEMRMLDRRLTSAHRLAVFDGGHTLPPDAVALEAIEWMELQAMVAGTRTRDEALVDRLLDKRRRAIDASTGAATFHLLAALVADFKSLRDVSREEARLTALSSDDRIEKAIARERNDDEAELRLLDEVLGLERGLIDSERRFDNLSRLRNRLSQWSRAAAAPAATPERSRARRLLDAVAAGASARTQDQEYLELVKRYRASR